MKTLVLNAQQQTDIALAAQLLQQGKLVAVPTETVYGLAADATNPTAVRAIFTAKGRPADHPLIVHVHSVDAISDWACDIPQTAWVLAKAFWPGPLTLLLKKAPRVNAVVTGGLDTIGLRMPAHPALLTLLQQHQLALAAPSANLYKKLSPTSAQHVMAGLNGRISAVLDGGPCAFGLESTIVDLTGTVPTIVRAGPISTAQLAAVLGRPVAQPQQHNVAVPGNVKAHYQPDTPLLAFSRDELLLHLPQQRQPVVVLSYSGLTVAPPHLTVAMPAEPSAYGRMLYQQLFQADKLGVSAIWCELPPAQDSWRAVLDRLNRAASSG